MKKGLLLLFFFVSVGVLNAQTLEYSRHFNLNNGLNQNTVTKVNQDTLGRIWIGTSGSLHFFNGFELKTIKEVKDRVLYIENTKDAVLCFTHSGIYKVHVLSLEVTQHLFQKAKYYSIQINEDGILLIDGATSNNIRFDFDLTIMDTTTTHPLLGENYLWRLPFKNGYIEANSKGLFYFGDSTLVLNNSVGNDFVWLPNGNLLISNSFGLFELGASLRLKQMLSMPLEDLFLDKSNNLWVSTVENGVFQISEIVLKNTFYGQKRSNGDLLSTWGVVTVKGLPYGLCSDGLKCLQSQVKGSETIEKLTKGLIIVAGIDGGGFTLLGCSQKGIYKLENGKLTQVFYNVKSSTDNTVMQFLKNETGFLAFTRSLFIQFNHQGELLFTKDYHNGKPWGYHMHLRKTKNGYMASSTEGVRVYDNELNQVALHESKLAKIFSMSCEFQNVVYVSSLDGGLFTLSDSLCPLPFPSKQLLSIKPFNMSLWVTGTKELYRYHKGQITTYNSNNGLPIKEFNQGGSNVIGESIYFSGVGGSIKWSKDLKEKNLKWVGILINNKLNHTEPILLKPSDNIVELSLEGINTVDRENIVLSYYKDSTWHTLEGLSKISFSASYGKNEFKTRMIHLPSGNAKENTLVIYREKPFYLEPWFRILMLFAGIGLVIGGVSLYKYIVTRKLLKLETKDKQIKEERLRISRELHDNIGARLTYIISSLDMEVHKTEQKELNKINEFARDTMGQLRETIWAVGNHEVTFSELMIRFKNYIDQISNLCTEQITFMDESKSDFALSPIETINYYRVFQEALNNATKYAQSTQIKVLVKEQDQQVYIEIKDNGIGFDLSSTPKSGGIQGMRNRMEEASGELVVRTTKDEGTQITMIINKR